MASQTGAWTKAEWALAQCMLFHFLSITWTKYLYFHVLIPCFFYYKMLYKVTALLNSQVESHTVEDVPEGKIEVFVINDGPRTIQVKWLPPHKPNGLLTYAVLLTGFFYTDEGISIIAYYFFAYTLRVRWGPKVPFCCKMHPTHKMDVFYFFQERSTEKLNWIHRWVSTWIWASLHNLFQNISIRFHLYNCENTLLNSC